MLAMVDNVLATLQPVVIPQEGYSLQDDGGRLGLYASGHRIEIGVTFYRMTNHRRTTLDPRSGEFEIEGKGPTVFRAVFGNQHIDLEVWP